MARKKYTGEGREATRLDCWYCEGTKRHMGAECGACNSSGKESVRKQLVKVYNAENDIPIRTNLSIE